MLALLTTTLILLEKIYKKYHVPLYENGQKLHKNSQYTVFTRQIDTVHKKHSNTQTHVERVRRVNEY